MGICAQVSMGEHTAMYICLHGIWVLTFGQTTTIVYLTVSKVLGMEVKGLLSAGS